jgi:hypothetical protein
VFVRRGGGLGNHGRWWSYEVGLRLVMAWVAVLCRLGGGFVGPVDTFQWGWSDFRPGRRPRMSWCDSYGLRPAALSSLGYRLSVCAASQVESERWHVGAAAPEGGDLG